MPSDQLDIDAIRQRHLRPEQMENRTFYEGHVLIDLANALEEIERLKSLMPPDERGPGFVGQGSWSVFAEKVVAERDALREQLEESNKEIERLRQERPAVVGWLRASAPRGQSQRAGLVARVLEDAARDIARGEHRREEGE